MKRLRQRKKETKTRNSLTSHRVAARVAVVVVVAPKVNQPPLKTRLQNRLLHASHWLRASRDLLAPGDQHPSRMLKRLRPPDRW